MTTPAPSTRNPDRTRLRLVLAGIDLFGRHGFEATSTRELARASGSNIGSIAYHFGGKDGLREACARHIAETIRAVAGPAVGLGTAAPATSAEAEALIDRGIDGFLGFMLGRPEAGSFVQFVVRELSAPSPTLDILYSEVFELVHRRLCELWATATGSDADSSATRLQVFTMVGQAVYFRIGQPAVLRRMGWAALGPAEIAEVIAAVRRNVRAMMAAAREEAGA